MRWLLGDFPAILGQVIKYQVVTKLIMAILIVPTYAVVTSVLLNSRGQGAVTNANMLPFLLSPQGIGFATLMLVMLLAGILLELCGFVTITARHHHGQSEASYKEILRYSLSKLPRFLGPGGFALVVYLVVLIPLSGLGANISFLEHIRIPNFITSVIEGNALYSAAYLLALTALAAMSFFLLFTFHFIVIADLSAGRAMTASMRLIWRNAKVVFVKFVWKTIVVLAVAGALLAVWWVFVFGLMGIIGADSAISRIALVLLLIIQQLIFAIIALVFVPFEVDKLTDAFDAAIAQDREFAYLVDTYPQIPAKTTASTIDKLLDRKRTMIALGVIAVLALAIPGGILFNDVFRASNQPMVVAHRAGGFTAPENSITGLENSIALHVPWVEIDVQRTKDGEYILNHDETFARAAGVAASAADLMLADIKALDISTARDGSEGVPTLREFLVAAKGRTNTFIELKGKSADPKMADDVIAIAEDLDMLDEVALISLNYDLITYIENSRPDVSTGFLYFLSFGDVTSLTGDYIILEESEATTARIAALNAANKNPIVWTVNTEESMDKFATVDVYALITDNMAELQQTIAEYHNETGADLMTRLFFDITE